MHLVPWILVFALAAAVVVLARLLVLRGRHARPESARVHATLQASPVPPAPSRASLAPAPLHEDRSRTVPRITSIRAPAAPPMTSAVEARHAAKLAIGRRDIRGAVDHYRNAGLVDEAVSLLVGVLGAPAEAAVMLAARGDHERAADLYEIAGRKSKAAREWAHVAEAAADPMPYLRRVRRLDPGLADALSGSALNSFEVHAAPTRQLDPGIVADLAPSTDEEEPDERDEEVTASGMDDADAERLATAVVEAASAALDSLPPDAGPGPMSRMAATSRRVERPSTGGEATGGSWTGRIEEEDLDVATGAMIDDAVVRAGVAFPLGELEAMTREEPCDLSNIEVFYRIGLARLAIGNWSAALIAFDAVEEASPGYRDADLRAEQIRAWQLSLGNRRLLDLGRFEILGRFEEREDSIVYRARENARARDVLLHVPRLGPETRYKERAERLALLDHPNLARVLAGIPLDGGGVLVSETADGPSLSDRLALGKRPTVVDALRIAAQLCEAIEEAGPHTTTSIDPTDIRIAPGGLVKLMRWAWSESTVSAPEIAFSAPEAGGGRGDERALVYAVGAVLVYALAGDPELARSAHDEASWAAIEGRAPYLPEAVKKVAKRATALEPSERLPSLKGLRLALRNLLRHIQRRASSVNIPAVRV